MFSGRASAGSLHFRYYRFASSSDDLFEAYRYLYLSFENTLYDFFPRQKQSEKDWLKAALRQAVAIYSLDLSPYAVGGSDPVDKFYESHYRAIRCATFHAQSDALLPGNPPDLKEVHDQLRILKPIVTQLLKAHFKVSFPTSGMTIYAMDKLLGAAVRFLHLATAPQEANLPQEIQTALAASGYFDAFPKSAEDIQPDTAEKLNRLIDDARASFPFDLTRSLWKENDKDMTMNGSSRRKQLAMRLHITTFAPSLFAF